MSQPSGSFRRGRIPATAVRRSDPAYNDDSQAQQGLWRDLDRIGPNSGFP
jgi:hypothetical protein